MFTAAHSRSPRLANPTLLRAAFLLLLLAGVSVLLTLLRSGESRPLLDVAVRVAPTTTWQGGIGNYPGYEPYFFLSDHEVLRFGGAEKHGYQARRLDLRTRSETNLPVRIMTGGWTYQMRLLSLSPDRRWLLWVSGSHRRTASGPYHYSVAAAALDGSARREAWPHPGGAGIPFWLPDGRSWAFWTNVGPASKVTLRRARFGNPTTTATAATVPDYQDIPLLLGYAGDGHDICLDQKQMLLSRSVERVERSADYIKIAFSGRTRKPALELVTVDMTGPAPTTALRRVHALVPLGAKTATVSLSPDGKRLAWVVVTPSASRLDLLRDALNHRMPALFPSPAPRPPRVSLWTSRLDGSRAHEIGYTAPTRGRFTGAFTGDSVPSSPQWTPDNKRISFLHRNALWIVAADE